MKSLIIILFLAVAGSLFSQHSSLYSDHKSFSIGDILTVIILEKSSASSSSGNATTKSFGHSAGTEAGTGPLNFIPLSGMSLKGNNSAKGDAQTSRSGALKATMSARIEAIDQNGNLLIKGSKSVKINGENEITTLQGTVRPQDVSADNKIESSNIADVLISYKGKGAINDGSKVGYITRFFNFLF